WNEVTPCNMPLDRLAKRSKEGVRAAGGFPMEFVTIAVSDGISMGHEGMRGSLVSREIIADSVECMVHSERLDALVTLAGCDKSLPGMLMAAARTNVPSVFLYGGSILPGHYKGEALDVVSVFEAVGACAAGTITETELGEIERRACPTEGSCAGMFTANTMASIAEAIGMALPGSASPPAVDRRRDDFAYESGRAVMRLLELDLRPRQIMTKDAFENAIAITMALGGSTNAVLHLLAIANEARVELELDDFNRIGARVAHVADMKPHGKYHMYDLDMVGGVQVVLKQLLAVEQARVEQLLQHDLHAAHHVEVVHVVFAVRLHVGHVRDACTDPVEIVELELHACLVGDREQVQHRVGGPTARHDDCDRVLERILRHDLPRAQVELEQPH